MHALYTQVNQSVTFILAVYVLYATFSRLLAINLRRMQWRFVAPVILAFCWSVSVAFTSLADEVDWFTPLGLLGVAVMLYNNRKDWQGGPPAHTLRQAYMSSRDARRPGDPIKRLRFVNACVGSLVLVSVGASGIGAIDGRGEPLQFYSAVAEPQVTAPNSTIDIVYDLRRVRVCSGYVDRWIVNVSGNAVVQRFERQPIGSMRPQERRTVRLAVQIGELPAGNYAYRALVYSACDDKNYVQQTNDVPFTVSTPMPVKE